MLIRFTVLALCFGTIAIAQGPPPGPQSYEATSQRSSVTTDTSVVPPGTWEIETGLTFSDSVLRWPWMIKFTPDTRVGWLRRAEFDVSFTPLESEEAGGERVTQAGDRVGLAMRTEVYRRGNWAFGVQPQAEFFVRRGRGARLGGTGIATVSFGSNTAVLNVTGTAATSPSPSNPARQTDVTFSFIRRLGESEPLRRWEFFAGLVAENPSNAPTAVTLGQGIAYHARADLILDLSVRELGLAEGRRDYRILLGLTKNLGRLW